MTNIIAIISYTLVTNWIPAEIRGAKCEVSGCQVAHHEIEVSYGQRVTNVTATFVFDGQTNTIKIREYGQLIDSNLKIEKVLPAKNPMLFDPWKISNPRHPEYQIVPTTKEVFENGIKSK